MRNFWQKLNKPFFALAPMADVTDCAFRKIISKYGKPDVFYTSFVSADGLAHREARKKLLIHLKYEKSQHPIVAQIFGSNPENIRSAAKLCARLGFDGVDINMGCPDRAVEKQGAGCGLIKTPEKSKEVILAAKLGVKDFARLSGKEEIPISVKTRLGYGKLDLAWIKFLLSQDIAALSIHLRTRREMSKVSAHWELMKEIVSVRDEIRPGTIIIGNGDVQDLKDARQKAIETGCDGIMLGRAIFGNPWLFAEKTPTTGKKLKVLIEHAKLFEKLLGGHESFAVMKKHFKAYLNGFAGAKELRQKLMETQNAKEVQKIINEFASNGISGL